MALYSYSIHRQIIWKNVGDSSCDPVFDLNGNVAMRVCRNVEMGMKVISKLRVAFKFRANVALNTRKDNNMTKKPLAPNNFTRVSKHSAGSGGALGWRMFVKARLNISFKGRVILHNIGWLQLDVITDTVARLLLYICQIIWKNVGDSSCDPVLTLNGNVAMRVCRNVEMGMKVISKLRVAFKFRAQSLVVVGADL